MKQSGSSRKSKENNPDLNIYFDKLKEENFDGTFTGTEAWLRNVNSNLSNKKSERKFSNMKNYFSANKFKLAYTFIILAFFVAACNYPVTQQETAGDVLKWSVSKDNADAISKIENLEWFKKGEYDFNTENVNGKEFVSYSLILPKEDHIKTSEFIDQLSVIKGVSDVKIIPLNEPVKRPFYSAILNHLFKINITATNMSDNELSQEVTNQLKGAGIDNAGVTFEKTENGGRMIKLVIPDHEFKKDGGFDMTIKDGQNITRMKEMKNTAPGDNEKYKGKSDEEIRNMVKQDHADMNLKDEQIEISRVDGAVKIKIKMLDGMMKEKLQIEEDVK